MRSGCSWGWVPARALARVRALTVPRRAGSFAPKKAKNDADDDDDGKGVVHDDIWVIDLKTLLWERVKKQGMAPTPRTSFVMAMHRDKRALLFGGVFDREGAVRW